MLLFESQVDFMVEIFSAAEAVGFYEWLGEFFCCCQTIYTLFYSHLDECSKKEKSIMAKQKIKYQCTVEITHFLT